MADQWYYSRGGQQAGPVTQDQLRQMVATGQLTPQDLAWTDGMPNWQPLGAIPQLGGWGASAAPTSGGPAPVGPGYQQPSQPYQPGYQPVGESHKGMAITGFVLSICGVFCCGIVLGLVGLILGIMARNGMTKSGNQDGRGLATSAIVIGIIAMVLNIVLIPYNLRTFHQFQMQQHGHRSF